MRSQLSISPRLAPRGVTLVEVIVALVLVAVGLLGIAGSSTLAMRATTSHSLAQRAAAMARQRVALLEAAGCLRALDGAVNDSTSGVAEYWRVVSRSDAVVALDDSVTWRVDGRRRHFVVRTALLC